VTAVQLPNPRGPGGGPRGVEGMVTMRRQLSRSPGGPIGWPARAPSDAGGARVLRHGHALLYDVVQERSRGRCSSCGARCARDGQTRRSPRLATRRMSGSRRSPRDPGLDLVDTGLPRGVDDRRSPPHGALRLLAASGRESASAVAQSENALTYMASGGYGHGAVGPDSPGFVREPGRTDAGSRRTCRPLPPP
jgi:hypothetical protein